jgi:hypothetical protein
VVTFCSALGDVVRAVRAWSVEYLADEEVGIGAGAMPNMVEARLQKNGWMGLLHVCWWL